MSVQVPFTLNFVRPSFSSSRSGTGGDLGIDSEMRDLRHKFLKIR